MAIQFNGNRNVAQHPLQQKSVAQHPLQQVAQQNDLTGRVAALEREVGLLRELIARQAVAPAAKSRAEYYREYRKRGHPKA